MKNIDDLMHPSLWKINKARYIREAINKDHLVSIAVGEEFTDFEYRNGQGIAKGRLYNELFNDILKEIGADVDVLLASVEVKEFVEHAEARVQVTTPDPEARLAALATPTPAPEPIVIMQASPVCTPHSVAPASTNTAAKLGALGKPIKAMAPPAPRFPKATPAAEAVAGKPCENCSVLGFHDQETGLCAQCEAALFPGLPPEIKEATDKIQDIVRSSGVPAHTVTVASLIPTREGGYQAVVKSVEHVPAEPAPVPEKVHMPFSDATQAKFAQLSQVQKECLVLVHLIRQEGYHEKLAGGIRQLHEVIHMDDVTAESMLGLNRMMLATMRNSGKVYETPELAKRAEQNVIEDIAKQFEIAKNCGCDDPRELVDLTPIVAAWESEATKKSGKEKAATRKSCGTCGTLHVNDGPDCALCIKAVIEQERAKVRNAQDELRQKGDMVRIAPDLEPKPFDIVSAIEEAVANADLSVNGPNLIVVPTPKPAPVVDPGFGYPEERLDRCYARTDATFKKLADVVVYNWALEAFIQLGYCARLVFADKDAIPEKENQHFRGFHFPLSSHIAIATCHAYFVGRLLGNLLYNQSTFGEPQAVADFIAEVKAEGPDFSVLRCASYVDDLWRKVDFTTQARMEKPLRLLRYLQRFFSEKLAHHSLTVQERLDSLSYRMDERTPEGHAFFTGVREYQKGLFTAQQAKLLQHTLTMFGERSPA